MMEQCILGFYDLLYMLLILWVVYLRGIQDGIEIITAISVSTT